MTHCLTCVVQKHLVDFGFIFASQLYLIRLIWLPKINPAKKNHENMLPTKAHIPVNSHLLMAFYPVCKYKFSNNLRKNKKAGEKQTITSGFWQHYLRRVSLPRLIHSWLEETTKLLIFSGGVKSILCLLNIGVSFSRRALTYPGERM